MRCSIRLRRRVIGDVRVSLHRRNPRRDANEPAIVDALEAVGAKVKRLSAAGVADLLVMFRGRIYLLEVKGRKGRPTEAQDETLADGWPVTTVREPRAALKAIGAVLDHLHICRQIGFDRTVHRCLGCEERETRT